MAHKDLISKHILKRLLLDIGIHLFKLDLVDAELLSTEEQRVEERRSDLVAKVKTAQDQHFILHLEIQTSNDSKMPIRMLRYLTDIQQAHPKQRIHQCIVYIGEKKVKMANTLNSPQLSYCYDLIDMREIDYQTLYNSDSPDALVLAILCDFKDQNTSQIVTRILKKLHALTQHDDKNQRDYLEMLEILANHRQLNIDIKEAYDMLNIDIERLPSYQIGLEQGLEQGLARGEKRGKLESQQQIAATLLNMQFPLEQIASITQLPLSEIEKITASYQPK